MLLSSSVLLIIITYIFKHYVIDNDSTVIINMLYGAHIVNNFQYK